MSKRSASEAEINGDDARVAPPPPPETDGLFKSVRHLFERVAGSGKPKASYPVINGATAPPKAMLRGIISDLASQSGRWGANFGLLASLADTNFLDGGLVDDKKYQVSDCLARKSVLYNLTLALRWK